MKNITKMIIIVMFVMVVGGVIILKQGKRNNENSEMTTIVLENARLDRNNHALPLLLDLGADRCIPCKMMAPILEELRKEYKGQFEVVFIDVWENPEEAKNYNIKLIPTQIFFDKQGKELFRHEGFYSKEDILGKWNELGIHLEPT